MSIAAGTPQATGIVAVDGRRVSSSLGIHGDHRVGEAEVAAYGEDETEQDTLLYVVFAETSESIDGRQDHGNAEKCRDQTGGNEGEEGWWVVTSRTQSPKAKQGNMSHQGKIEPLSHTKAVDSEGDTNGQGEAEADKQLPPAGWCRLKEPGKGRHQEPRGEGSLETLNLQHSVIVARRGL